MNITGMQARMARALLCASLSSVAKEVGVSHTTIRNFELEKYDKVSCKVAIDLEGYYTKCRIYFGPKDGVCFKSNIFEESHLLSTILLEKLAQSEEVDG